MSYRPMLAALALIQAVMTDSLATVIVSTSNNLRRRWRQTLNSS